MIDERALYRVKIPGVDALILATCLEFGPWGVGFHDTCRGHSFEGELTRETKKGFIWRRRDGTEITFEALDLDTFEKEIRPRIGGWLPEKFLSTLELWEFYRRAYRNAGSHYG
jgi:hypothetical protein